MKCEYCGVDRDDVKTIDYGYSIYTVSVPTHICPDCATKAQKMAASAEWKEDATCPACRGKLREQGDIDASVLELGQMIYTLVTYLKPVTLIIRSVTGMGKAIFSAIKGEEMSKVRQCSKCDAYATKCPNCSKIFIIGKPKLLDGTSAKCPKCGQKVLAFE
jgi:predicted Zn finger-like uncharacterized protein